MRSSRHLKSYWFDAYKPKPPQLSVLHFKLKKCMTRNIFITETLPVDRMWVSLSVNMSIILLFPSKSDTKSNFLNKPRTFWWNRLNPFFRSCKSRSFGDSGNLSKSPHISNNKQMYDLIDHFDVKIILLALFIHMLEQIKLSFNKPVSDIFNIKSRQSSLIKLIFFT